MSERDIDISDMQCWVFRMAQKRWENHQWNVQLSLKKMTYWDLFKREIFRTELKKGLAVKPVFFCKKIRSF